MQSPDLMLRLGTRGSPLARAQAHIVRDLLCKAHGWPSARIEIITCKTSGDRFTDRPLSAIGGKGLFTKELEDALIEGSIDFAVHSMKDVATVLPDGLEIVTVLARENPFDALIALGGQTLETLPKGAVIGTSSLRRRAQILRVRPDFQVIEFRGTVETRLRKLDERKADASFLAMAGLIRLGRDDLFDQGFAHEIRRDDFLPAVAQGAIGIETRQDDTRLREFLAVLDDPKTHTAILAERVFLHGLDGSCRTPIAAYAEYHDGELHLRGEVLSPDGRRFLGGTWSGFDPIRLGQQAALELLERGAADVLNGG